MFPETDAQPRPAQTGRPSTKALSQKAQKRHTARTIQRFIYLVGRGVYDEAKAGVAAHVSSAELRRGQKEIGMAAK